MKRKNRKSKPEKANGVEETDNDTTEATQNGGEEKEQQSGDSVSKKRKNKKTGKQTEENGEQVEDKKQKGGKKKDKYIDVEGDEEEEEVEEEEEEEEEPVEKKRKSGGKKASKVADEENGTDEEDNDDEEYEVQAIIDEKMIRGVKHYLIRWKGYDADGDTWEPASTLNCPDALEEYKKKQKKPAKKLLKKTKDTKIVEDWDENEDFEVDRILEVHFRRDGKREFLVSWKGYPPSDSSWEPEENMSCKDLIQRFLAKVERAREVDQRELRVNRPATERFTLSAVAKGRRLSKRHQGKQRVQYHDAE